MKNKLIILSIMLMAYVSPMHTAPLENKNHKSVNPAERAQMLAEHKKAAQQRLTEHRKGTVRIQTSSKTGRRNDGSDVVQPNIIAKSKVTDEQPTETEFIKDVKHATNYVTDVQKLWEVEVQKAQKLRQEESKHDDRKYHTVTEVINGSVLSTIGFEQAEPQSVMDKLLKPRTKEQLRELENVQEMVRQQELWEIQAGLYPVPKLKFSAPHVEPEQTRFEYLRSCIARHPYKTGAVVVVVGGLVTAGVVAYKKGYFDKFENPFAKAKRQSKSTKKHRRNR